MLDRTDKEQFAGTASSGRREFLRACALLAGAGSLASAAKGGYQIGCWTRPWGKFDYPQALDGIAKAGFKNVGLMSMMMGGKPADITWQSTPEQVAAVKAEVAKRKLKIISMWGGAIPFRNSVEEGVAGLKRLIDHSASCGCPKLLLGGVSRPEQTEPYYKVVAECCDYGVSKGVNLAVKPHGGTNATGQDCRRIVERVGHKNFGIYYDPGNIYFYSDGKLDPVEDVPAVDGLVVAMTVKDFRMPKEVMVTPGTGMVNFKALLPRMKKGGFTSGPLVVEGLDQGDLAHVNAEARKARLFLEKLVKA